MHSGIIGTGHILPEEIIGNAHLQEINGASDEWITRRTGIKERRRAASGESASTLGALAARQALQKAERKADEIDLIICTTISPDKPLPSTACLIQQIIGANQAACFDLQAACTGFIYGLEIASKMIASGAYRTALVVSVDLLTRLTDYRDPKTSALFGDGAGAAVIAPVPDGKGLLASKISADGRFGNLVHIPAGGCALPASHDTVRDRLHFMQMDGNRLFRLAVQSMVDASEQVLRAAGLAVADLDFFIPHQANRRILDSVVDRMGILGPKVLGNIEYVGNTASASIPIVLDQALRSSVIHDNATVLLTAFGGGATWGAALLKF